MRFLAVCVLVALVAPVHAADKDEDKAKAKAVVGAFLKAVAAKDADAVMKTVDVPFVINFGSPSAKTIEKADELKEAIAKLLKNADPEKVMAIQVGKVYDMEGFAKYAKDNAKNKPEDAEQSVVQAEKLVGKSGYMVMLKVKEDKEVAGILIRFKDGKALIASVPK